MKTCKSKLVQWHKSTFKNVAVEIQKCKTRIQNLLNRPHDQVNWEIVSNLRKRIDELWKHEEKYWGQRSRVKWLNYGDKNTKFFHASTIQRKDGNKLLGIKMQRVIGWKVKMRL